MWMFDYFDYLFFYMIFICDDDCLFLEQIVCDNLFCLYMFVSEDYLFVV